MELFENNHVINNCNIIVGVGSKLLHTFYTNSSNQISCKNNYFDTTSQYT